MMPPLEVTKAAYCRACTPLVVVAVAPGLEGGTHVDAAGAVHELAVALVPSSLVSGPEGAEEKLRRVQEYLTAQARSPAGP